MGILDSNFDPNALGGNQLLQMGLGILANNQGHGGAFAPAFGGGVQQGLQNASAYQQQQMHNNLYKMQIDKYKADLAKEKRLTDWQASFGKPNADLVTQGGMVNAPQGTDAPNFSMVKQADTVTPNGRFDENQYLLDGVGAGAYSPMDLIKLQRGEHEYDFKDGVMFDKKTGTNAKLGDGKELDTNDIKGYNFAKTPAGGSFKGSFEQYLQIKPALMANIAGGQLAVAQERVRQGDEQNAYNLPPPVKATPKVATLQDIADTAKATGKSTKQVTVDLKAQGYKIGGK